VSSGQPCVLWQVHCSEYAIECLLFSSSILLHQLTCFLFISITLYVPVLKSVNFKSRQITSKQSQNCGIFRPPNMDMLEGHNKCCCAFLSALCLGKPCNGCPSNVYQRFSDVWHYFTVQRHLPTPPLIFTGREKVQLRISGKNTIKQ